MTKDLKEAKLKKCDALCPIGNFINILNPVLPSDSEFASMMSSIYEGDFDDFE